MGDVVPLTNSVDTEVISPVGTNVRVCRPVPADRSPIREPFPPDARILHRRPEPDPLFGPVPVAGVDDWSWWWVAGVLMIGVVLGAALVALIAVTA